MPPATTRPTVRHAGAVAALDSEGRRANPPTPVRRPVPSGAKRSRGGTDSRSARARIAGDGGSPPPAGVIAFDLDGTILDSIGRISVVAADVMFQTFGTPVEEARIHYLATTGMPFEAQLAQLYPDVPAAERAATARLFHTRKINEAYATAKPFADVPRVLRRLSQGGWTMVISTGAEKEMADLILEREGLRYWFEDVMGSAQGTKREHLAEYVRRYPGRSIFLVGDSRFDMEAASSVPGVRALGRASTLPGWSLTPDDLRRWGAQWADYSLIGLPEGLERLGSAGPSSRSPSKPARRAR